MQPHAKKGFWFMVFMNLWIVIWNKKCRTQPNLWQNLLKGENWTQAGQRLECHLHSVCFSWAAGGWAEETDLGARQGERIACSIVDVIGEGSDALLVWSPGSFRLSRLPLALEGPESSAAFSSLRSLQFSSFLLCCARGKYNHSP